MPKFSAFALLFFALIISSCATPTKDLMTIIQPGMKKAEVLELAGNPIRSDRANGHDRWAYKDTKGQELYVFFSEGKVQYVGPQFRASDAKKPNLVPIKDPPGEFKDL